MPSEQTPAITAVEAPHGLRLTDPIEGAQFTLLTSRSVTTRAVDPESFEPPVDTAATVSVTELETPYQIDALVRDETLSIIAECSSGERTAVGPGEYYVELSSAKMKLYLHVESSVVFEPETDRVRLSFPDSAEIRVGIRSLHEQPAATITTTTDPGDIAQALSHLGSALKTTSCERSFPTLRGHPPLIEIGPELSIPDSISTPETGITIQVPSNHRSLFPITSLAYYLGATVELGSEPRLVADGASFSLRGDDGFEATVARVLKQVFLLDCVTRTEGMYDVPLHERHLIEDAVNLDFASLYDESLAGQIRRYLDVDAAAVADAVPQWKLTADVVPDPASASVLPFLADELAVVRCPDGPEPASHSSATLSPEVTEFFRTAKGFVRSTTRNSNEPSNTLDQTVFRPRPADSIEQTYVGDGIPIGASKMTVDEYYRRLDFESEGDGQTRVLVVCNESEMSDENVVGETYGTREWLEFDITIHEQVTTAEFTDLLETDADFLHYIGHADEDGIRCTDGHLDARTLDGINVNAFLLNACQSYEQGRALVDAGAVGGIVTLTDVLDQTATEIGRTVARLLNQGFSLLSMLGLLEKRNRLAQRYMVVGDGNTTLVESESGTPISVAIEHAGCREYEISVTAYPTKYYPMGTIFRPHITDETTRYLNAGKLSTFDVSRNRFKEFLDMQLFPVLTEDGLFWSDKYTV
ncbi:hypothetical protein BRC91_13210 [Halobacteriales archaeon QS_4_62_28]|nr:MAG: hypothetical protein BRC91_13210 [Halobacteriales archaeon QS_4_62_28]